MDLIQGYVPAVKHETGKIEYVNFYGGFSGDWKKAYCEPKEEAERIANKNSSFAAKPCIFAVDTHGNINPENPIFI